MPPATATSTTAAAPSATLTPRSRVASHAVDRAAANEQEPENEHGDDGADDNAADLHPRRDRVEQKPDDLCDPAGKRRLDDDRVARRRGVRLLKRRR